MTKAALADVAARAAVAMATAVASFLNCMKISEKLVWDNPRPFFSNNQASF